MLRPSKSKDMKKPLYLILFITLCTCISTACSRKSADAPPEITTLDSLIDRRDEFDRIKLMRLGELRSRQAGATETDERFSLNSQLYEEYLTYNSDSAMKYVDANIAMARRNGDTARLNGSLIQKSYLLAAIGLLREAESLLATVDRAKLTDKQLVPYFGQKIYLYSHMGNYTGGETNEYYVMERNYKDSIMTVITPDHPEYLWYRGWDVIGTDHNDPELNEALRRRIEYSAKDTRRDAMNAYVLARLYQQAGDEENSRKYMVLSAMIDVRIANAEIASLDDLAKIMFANGEGDIDRAYRYINFSLDKAISYPNRGRAFDIMKTLDAVSKAYQERNHRQQRRTNLFLTLVCLLSAVLAMTIAIIIKQNRRLIRQGRNLDSANKQLNRNLRELSDAQAQLAEANTKLKELNADITRKNDELTEANYVKEEYIGYIFTICSNYIRKLEEFRKSIHVKAMTRQYREIEAETAGGDNMKDELREFYRSFDTVFLHIYPDFVNDFNSLLQDDKRIVPKEGELLNTELRIYALVRLGISDSVKIADFLHCSAQTVYNNRFKVRNKAIIDKKDFAEAVRTLGKFEKPV